MYNLFTREKHSSIMTNKYLIKDHLTDSNTKSEGIRVIRLFLPFLA